MDNTEKSVEILAIGREVLDGRINDTNSTEIALTLKALGHIPRFGQRVDDDAERMLEAFAISQARADFVIATGGLGPTSDDLTAEVFCRFLGVKPEFREDAFAQVKAYFDRIKRPVTDLQRKQALLPPGARILPNPVGSAPGFSVTHQGVAWFFMPGVPREMRPMLRNHIVPHLPVDPMYRAYTWYTQFTGESILQEQLAPAIKRLDPKWELSFRTRYPENHIGLYGSVSSTNDKTLYDSVVTQITEILGDDVFSHGERPGSLEEEVVRLAKKQNVKIATAESCTGGLVAHRLTQVPGASDVFLGSWVTYSNAAKSQELGVSPQTLDAHGAVSEAVARELAQGALTKARPLASDSPVLVVSTTGIAGPGGGSEKKPVGLCFIGCAVSTDSVPNATSLRIEARAGLEREQVKLFFSQHALDQLRRVLLRMPARNTQ